jgi:hypothetical protein
MSAQAMRDPSAATAPVQAPAKGGSIRGRRSRVVRLPGPEALLHPSAAEALILAFRPLTWSR